MRLHLGDANPNHVGLRVTGAVADALIPLLILLAIVRPEMMGMAMLHKLMSAVGP